MHSDMYILHQVVHANMLLFELEVHVIPILHWFSYTIFSPDNVRTVTIWFSGRRNMKLSIVRNDKWFESCN